MGRERRQRLAADPSSAPPALSCRQLPPWLFPAAAVAAASPAGSGYCNQCRAPPALPMPRSCQGLGWPPLPGPGLNADGRNLGSFPPKASPGSAFKGPAAQLGLLVVRWGWGWGWGAVLPKFSTKGCSAPVAHQAGFCGLTDSAAWGGSGLLLLPTWVHTEPGPLPQGSVLPSRKCLEAKEAPRPGLRAGHVWISLGRAEGQPGGPRDSWHCGVAAVEAGRPLEERHGGIWRPR